MTTNKQSYFLELGLINTLLIDRLTTPGAYLMAQDGNDVLLPGQYLTQDMKEGDLIDVFYIRILKTDLLRLLLNQQQY